MRLLVLILLALGPISIAASKPQSPEVQIRGSLRQVMHAGDLSAQISLAELKSSSHLYAIGAVADLKGEIVVFDSRPYVSSVAEGRLVTDSSFDIEAALLVWSSVPSWHKVVVPESMDSDTQLAAFVATQAARLGIDTAQPFPFRISGKIDELGWHVIDWPKEDSVHTHEKHESAGLHGILRNENVDIIGFYSNRHQGVITHMTSRIHLHVLARDHSLAAHVDLLKLGRGVALWLPN